MRFKRIRLFSSQKFRTGIAALILVLFAFFTSFTSPQLLHTAQSATPEEPGEILAEPTSRIYDPTTQRSHRVADLNKGSKNGLAPKAGITTTDSSQTVGQLSSRAPSGYSPSQIRRAYEIDELRVTGKGQIIAIVNAFHYPTAAADLSKFIKTFGLRQMYGLPGRAPCTVAAGPHPCFEVVYAQGEQPDFDEGWAFESAIDTQWAHAIAPGADILLVETPSNQLFDMLLGVDFAVSQGASVVSMSWGVSEIAAEMLFDHHFDHAGVVFVAGSGDTGNPGMYPAASPFVVAVGGTKLFLDRYGNRIKAETAWSGSGGGISIAEPEPSYQFTFPIPNTFGFRGYPDVAYLADPATGIAVYDSAGYLGHTGWFITGGTSIGAPQWAGLIALANQLRHGQNLSSNDVINSPLYDAALADYRENYFDIRSGSNGSCGAVCKATKGYDFVTGLGSPRAEGLVKQLADK